jgi:zinc transporter ZupT
MGLVLVGLVIRNEYRPAHEGLAGLVLAVALLEASFRRWREYAYQAFTAGAVATAAVLVAFLAKPGDVNTLLPWGPLPNQADVFIVLPITTAIAAFSAWRLMGARAAAIPSARPAAAVAAIVSGAFLATFEWRALAPNAVAPTWALTGVALIAIATWRRAPMLRWLAVMFSAGAVVRGGLVALGWPPLTQIEKSSIAVVIASVYLACWLARRTKDRPEGTIAFQSLTALSTLLLATLEWRSVSILHLGPTMAATGGVLLGIGLARGITDLRWHGHLLLISGAVLASSVFGVRDPLPEAWTWLSAVIALLYVCGLVTSRAFGGTPKEDSLESLMPGVFLLGATGLLAGEIVREVRPSLITLALGAQGLGSMVVGLTARERLLRLSGLALLLACILKLFVYDLRELEALARIFSFVVLGLILLAISWAYTRYREQIKKFL